MHRGLNALSRVGPGLVSQGLNSIGNLLLVLAVARVSASGDFGGWSLIYASYAAALVLSRTLASTPMLIAESRQDEEKLADQRGSVGLAGVIGLVLGLGVVVVGLALHGPSAGACIVFGVAMPMLLGQDALRYVFFQCRQAARAALIDGAWVALQLLGFVLLRVADASHPLTLTAVWATGGGISMAIGLIVWRGRLSLVAVRAFVGRHRNASTRLLAEAGMVAASTTALPFLLAWTAGLAAAGALRAGTTLMGGVALLVLAMTPIATVEAVSRVRAGRDLQGLLRLWTWTIGVSAATYGGALLLLPAHLGHVLLGQSWNGARVILIPLLAQALLRGPFTGVPMALRARRLLNEAVKLRVRTTIVNTALPLLGGAIWGLRGAAWFIVLAAVVNNVQSISAWRRASGRTVSAPTDSPLTSPAGTNSESDP